LKNSDKALRWSVAVFVLLVVSSVQASQHKSEAWARSQFATAEHLHQTLEGRPAQALARADYETVITAYRRVYFEAPTSTKADPSVVAVAQLLEEMGRRFEDPATLHSAIRQYEFLRRQYPGSKARFGALFHIGEIYKEDLHDKQRADEVFHEFLRWYPRNQFAEEARKALLEPAAKPVVSASLKSKIAVNSKVNETGEDAEDEKAVPPKPEADQDSVSAREITPGKLIRVTGIRHWSRPGSIRVAIDLQSGVKFEAQRIDHPDRIFFDLFETKLDPALGAKSLDVDEALLKKVRISQFKPRQTRVVLEVGPTSEFQATLLSNPPRLMIDVRDKKVAKTRETEEIQRADESKPEPAPESRMPGVGQPEVVASDLPDSIPLRQSAEQHGPTLRHARNSPADETAGGNITVITSDGVKKTIVDSDEDDETADEMVAKLEPSETKAATVQPSEPVRVDHPKEKPGRGKHKLDATLDAREAQPTAAGDRSLIRALGLKIGKIVIDPGHGGHDTGTIGPGGLEEKDLVLDVSKRLGKLLETRLGAQVIYTRSDDTFIPLEGRTAIANQEGADLFVSVHANSSHDPDARGVETYYLNFTTSAEALEVAARENAVSDKSIHELQDLVKKIALKEKIEESREFAVDVDHSLHSGLAAKNAGIRDRGVKKAPFIVLIGANMPSILAEISFLSNPGDERRLKTGDYRQKIAEALYRGMAKYVNGLSGVKVASKIEKTGTE
jgi:N-acetylmuramoyl-L-alanine amidase